MYLPVQLSSREREKKKERKVDGKKGERGVLISAAYRITCVIS